MKWKRKEKRPRVGVGVDDDEASQIFKSNSILIKCSTLDTIISTFIGSIKKGNSTFVLALIWSRGLVDHHAQTKESEGKEESI